MPKFRVIADSITNLDRRLYKGEVIQWPEYKGRAYVMQGFLERIEPGTTYERPFNRHAPRTPLREPLRQDTRDDPRLPKPAAWPQA